MKWILEWILIFLLKKDRSMADVKKRFLYHITACPVSLSVPQTAESFGSFDYRNYCAILSIF